jgi:hypothetical protein
VAAQVGLVLLAVDWAAAAQVLRQALRVLWALRWAHSAPQEVQGLPQGVPVLTPAGLF